MKDPHSCVIITLCVWMNKMNVLHNTYVETVSLSCKFVYIHGQCSVSCWENIALMVWLGFGHKNLNVGVRKGSCFIATNTTGKCPEVQLKVSSGFMHAMLKRCLGVVSCLTVIWQRPSPSCHATTVPSTSWHDNQLMDMCTYKYKQLHSVVNLY